MIRGTALAVALCAAASTALADQEERFAERIEVSRVLLDVRIVGGNGNPLLGLEPDDLAVRVDGHPVTLESVHWIAGTTPYAEGLTPEVAAATGSEPGPAGRLIVFLFQKDLSPTRTPGLLRMKNKALDMIDRLRPDDRIAVLSFDSHLKLWLDFTNDRGRLKRVINRSIFFESEPRDEEPGPSPSLAEHFDREAARRAAAPETALLQIARALQPVPGAKVLAFFGWGMGHLSGGTVQMHADYDPAVSALTAARVSVFSLDVTDADYHSLEVGLKQVAEDTGGSYMRTHDFAGLAIQQLEQALVGYYTIAFEKPLLPRGQHVVKIELTHRKGRVLTTGTYED